MQAAYLQHAGNGGGEGGAPRKHCFHLGAQLGDAGLLCHENKLHDRQPPHVRLQAACRAPGREVLRVRGDEK